MSQTLSLGYSTCPNDTFIFHALVHGQVTCPQVKFKPVLKDVEALNQDAIRGRWTLSKLSMAALGHLTAGYALLRSGAALGRGCGPLIVSRQGHGPGGIPHGSVAVPGLRTTANLLLGLFAPTTGQRVPMVFDRIMPAVAGGSVDYGVIIHEGRFTYQKYGLQMCVDLGKWWEQETGLPLPLGGIAVRRDIGADLARQVERAIAKSVAYALADPNASREYVRRHAQEMDDDIVRQHIELYVNDYSLDIGPEGRTAIEHLFSMARSQGLIPPSDLPIWLSDPVA